MKWKICSIMIPGDFGGPFCTMGNLSSVPQINLHTSDLQLYTATNMDLFLIINHGMCQETVSKSHFITIQIVASAMGMFSSNIWTINPLQLSPMFIYFVLPIDHPILRGNQILWLELIMRLFTLQHGTPTCRYKCGLTSVMASTACSLHLYYLNIHLNINS
jgi:hypothetical protein